MLIFILTQTRCLLSVRIFFARFPAFLASGCLVGAKVFRAILFSFFVANQNHPQAAERREEEVKLPSTSGCLFCVLRVFISTLVHARLRVAFVLW